LSRTDILMEIKTAEAETKAKVQKAEADRKDAIAEARRQSVKRIQDAEAQMRSSYESVIAKEKEALDARREALLGEGREIAVKIESDSKERIQVVKNHLSQEFERTLDVVT